MSASLTHISNDIKNQLYFFPVMYDQELVGNEPIRIVCPSCNKGWVAESDYICDECRGAHA